MIVTIRSNGLIFRLILSKQLTSAKTFYVATGNCGGHASSIACYIAPREHSRFVACGRSTTAHATQLCSCSSIDVRIAKENGDSNDEITAPTAKSNQLHFRYMVLFYSVFYVSIIGRSDYLSRNAYLAVTAHFVSNCGKLTQLLLAIEPIPGPKTAICIKEMIDELVSLRNGSSIRK